VGGTTRLRARLSARRLCLAGVAMIVAGGALVGSAEAVSAATPTLSFTPTTPLGPVLSLGVVVSGSGFSASMPGGLLECSDVQNQPTVDVNVKVGGKVVDLGKLPVGCGQPTPEKTTSSGKLPSTAVFSLSAGTLGPPAAGTDSTGNDSATDAKGFPCPPTSVQAPAQCVIMFVDSAGESATAPIQFSFQSGPTTTTIPSSTTTTPSSPTTTTTTAALLNSQNSSNIGSGSSTNTVTAASGSSLAFTGPSPMLWVIVLMGLVFVLFGAALLLIVDVPRRFALLTLARLTRLRGRRLRS